MTTFDVTVNKNPGKPVAHHAVPRALPRPAKKLDALDVIVCGGAAIAFAHVKSWPIEDARAVLAKRYSRYDDELVKAFVDPARTDVPGWAAEVVAELHSDFIGSLVQRSAFAQLAQQGLLLNFGRAGRIVVPHFSPNVGGAFLGEGEPIPVAQGDTSGPILTRKKMAVLIAFTRELNEGSVPAFEGLARMRLQESTAIVLDSCLLDDEPGTDIRPPGLLNGAINIGSSGILLADLQAVAAAVTRGYARNPVLMMHPVQALAVNLGQYKLPLIVSSSVPLGTVIAIDAADFVAAGSDAPRFEVSGQAALHMESETPQHITNGGVASPVRSLWQTDTLSLRMILEVDWCLRRAIAFVRLTADFPMPAVGATGLAHVTTTTPVEVGDQVWLEPTGYFSVEEKDEEG